MRLLRLSLLGVGLCLNGQVLADTCTIIAEAQTGRVIKQDGDCERRSSPASTFKIALSLMGYDAGILEDETNPAWPYRAEYQAWNETWKKTTTPQLWLRDSVVWYSQALTQKLGAERFKGYVDSLDYGNRDVSGDKIKRNGLTHSWLSSSLQISPVEQIAFLNKLLERKLPVSDKAITLTKAIMPTFPLPDGATVYGKTGAGFQRSPDGTLDRNRQFGWFVGWVTKAERTILFARLIRDEKKEPSVASFRARDTLLAELPELLKE